LNPYAEDALKNYANKFRNIEIQKGHLYIVSTPIGNLEDISFRAIKVLEGVDLIACEDTRRTGILLAEYKIKKKVVSYYSHVETEKTDLLTDELIDGKSVALVSDAGTPCISDPGSYLVSSCIEKNIPIISIPGCSSLIHSLVLSGFELKNFYFRGFLPKKKGRQSTLAELAKMKMLIVIFESPFRVQKTIDEILAHFGNVEISVSRELTKKFEQTIRGTVSSFMKRSFRLKGEFVIIINNT